MAKQTIALTLCAALLTGCATAGGTRVARMAQPPAAAQRSAPDPAVMAEYVQKLPPGTRVRVDRASGPVIRGTLMKASADGIIVQPRTRIPEPPVEISLKDIVAVTPEAANGSNVGKAIGIGAAAGAAAALGVILILILAFGD
jgi:hypothetical protein